MTHVLRPGFALAAILAIVNLSAADAAAQSTADLPNPYSRVENFLKLPAGRILGATSAVEVDRDGRSIWVFDRCGANTCAGSTLAPVMKFDDQGNLITSFGAGLFIFPHGIYVDREGNLWLSDGQGPDGKDPARDGKGHQVFKFSPDGKLLMTLGTAGVAAETDSAFNAPSTVVVGPNGDIYVADGHGATTNNRVVKFSRDGRFIKAWGRHGAGPGEFNPPHAIAMDSQGRLFVADRANNRIQIFDQDGNYLDEWKQFGRPSGIFIDTDDTLYVADSQSNAKTNPGFQMGTYIGSARDGKLTAFVPDPKPEGSGEEAIAVDAQGNIYGAQVSSRALVKYVKN
jgi:DNA-binding beta-propeller fold protein YncE